MAPIRRSYCLDCDWSATSRNRSRQELTSLVVEHATEYGHDIESEIIPDFKNNYSLHN
jgi:predicted small metal-binding protein